MSTKAKRHTHKYYQAEVSAGRLWACALPDCGHWMPAHYANLVLGKASLCWKCGERLIIGSEHMKMTKPLCDACNPEFKIPEATIPLVKPKSSEEILRGEAKELDANLCVRCRQHPKSPSNNLGLCIPCFLL